MVFPHRAAAKASALLPFRQPVGIDSKVLLATLGRRIRQSHGRAKPGQPGNVGVESA